MSGSPEFQTVRSAPAYPPAGGEAAASPTIDRKAEPSSMMTSNEAAKYLGYSGSWMRQSRMVGKSGPPFIRCGRSIRYRRADLDHWQEEHLCMPGSDYRSAQPIDEQQHDSAQRLASAPTTASQRRRAKPQLRRRGGGLKR
jgi:excisionase family DNA binding protein